MSSFAEQAGRAGTIADRRITWENHEIATAAARTTPWRQS
jgi:hypothetical protein